MPSWRSFLFSYARRSRTIGLAITLALGGTALVAPGGCTLNTQGLSAGGSGSSSTTTTSTTTTSTTSTGPVGCTNDIDCGTAPSGSCTKKICSSSVCADVTDLTNAPPDDMKPCTAELCSGEGKPYYPAIPSGMPCQGTAGVCDGAGTCVTCTLDAHCPTGMGLSCDPITHTCGSCTDGIQNGAETGVDCGGGSCMACNGTSCIDGTSCHSGICADKVCCDAACTGSCKSCDAQGSPGTCISTPPGQADLACAATQACDAAGMCKAAAGEPCTDSIDCAVGVCIGYRCRLPTGSKCNDDALCASGLCANAVCTACNTNSQCKSNSCAAPTCNAPGGALCSANAQCAGGLCQSALCQLNDGSACTVSTDCKSGVCSGGLCAPCVVDADCSGGAKCNGTFGPSTCSLPTGAYCYTSVHCPLGTTCQGLPYKCQ